MATDILSSWKDAFAALTPTDHPTAWADELADWVDSHISAKLVLDPGVVSGDPIVYTWDAQTFADTLKTASPGSDPNAITVIADAWELATLSGIMAVPSGASLGAPTPATTWSAPPLTVVDPASVVAAKTVMTADLLAMPPTADIDEVALPEILRTAFLGLTFTLTGLNSVPPPTGPQPLPAPFTPVV